MARKFIGIVETVALYCPKNLSDAHKALEKARERFKEQMREAYPTGRKVRVHHERGEFEGIVTYWDFLHQRLVIKNSATGKESKRWIAQIELIGE